MSATRAPNEIAAREIEDYRRDGFDARPGTFLESPRMRDVLPEVGLCDGDAIRGELFPEVWPRSEERSSA
jgi:hypothetical protein